jgi:hypothetical protein
VIESTKGELGCVAADAVCSHDYDRGVERTGQP